MEFVYVIFLDSCFRRNKKLVSWFEKVIIMFYNGMVFLYRVMKYNMIESLKNIWYLNLEE